MLELDHSLLAMNFLRIGISMLVILQYQKGSVSARTELAIQLVNYSLVS